MCPIFGFITARKSDILLQTVSFRFSKNDKDKDKEDMGLKLQRGRNGEWRRKWYGRYMEAGTWKEIPLATPMAGKMPRSLKERGDAEFERSRLLAEQEFKAFDDERKTKGAAEHLTAKLIQSKTGHGVDYIRLADMEAEWRKLRPHRRSESQESNISAWFRLFARSVHRSYLYEVTAEDVAAFHEALCRRYSKSTTLRITRFLKGVFALLLPLGVNNPWAMLDMRVTAGEVVHRRPLGNEEIRKLLDEARRDPMLYGITVTALCTGLRIGDVANLRWDEVDMREGIISLTTRKTGASVHIPIFGMLRPVLESALAERDEEDGEFVFPAAARLYRDNADGLYRMGKTMFARALFAADAEREAAIEEVPTAEKMDAREVMEAISTSSWQRRKKESAGICYRMYRLEGKSYRDIQAETGWSRGHISYYLHEVERLTGLRIVDAVRDNPTSTASLLRRTRQERTVGAHAASLYGWHSLRATFVVLALNEGLPLEDVRRIVGHTTADMTLEYYNPTKTIAAERFRRKMSATVLGMEDEAGSPQTHGTVKPVTGGDSILSLVANLSPAQRAALKQLL